MPNAKLRVSIPDSVWMHDITVGYPGTQFRVLATLWDDDRGIAVLELQSPDSLPILGDIEQRESITDVELLWKQAQTTMVQVEMRDPRLLYPLLQAGIPLHTPFEVADGTAIWEVTTPSARLSTLGTQLEQADIDFEIEYIRDETNTPTLDFLTDRQQELLFAAVDQGYYETPRRATLTEVSQALGISKATGSELLHRAESNLVMWFIEQHATPGREISA